MTNDLKNHIADNPQISHVYFNEKNEWQFYPKKGFNKKVSRKDVLDAKIASDTVEHEGNKALLSTEPGHASADLLKKAEDVKTPPQQAQGSVKGPDLDKDGQVDGAGSDALRKVEEKISTQNDKK